jgi:hypothetical protein
MGLGPAFMLVEVGLELQFGLVGIYNEFRARPEN